LEQLYEELKEKNFAVVGFPCNQFGAQEPGTAAEIQSFCSLTYGVTFPLTEKIDVTGAHQHPLYAWLTAQENSFPGAIGWNFEKFLISRDGRVMCRYPSATKPTEPTFLQDLADVL
jgi:glutathione peroxidase